MNLSPKPDGYGYKGDTCGWEDKEKNSDETEKEGASGLNFLV